MARKEPTTSKIEAPAFKRAGLPTIADLLSGGEGQLERLSLLLSALENPLTERAACAVLHDLADALPAEPPAQLWLNTVDLSGHDKPLRLFLTAAVFSPEDWGRTFAEGLLKRKESFDGKKVVELGTGSGWIGLLLLRRTSAVSVLGLDINPQAVLMAGLNKWLNGTTRTGEHLISQAGIPITKAFRAAESNLLSHALAQSERFDRVVGCIPQVLHPDAAATRTAGHLSEKDLYDLSNYCFEQGILEDRFGLPLIASALEQAQLCLNPRGSVTLILGGRPGPQAIESMFKRRGYSPELLWSRRIRQADDTDLASLVVLERTHGIRFNFFMAQTSADPVSASTAVRLLKSGKPIYHDLLVYDAETRFERPTTGLVRNLHEMGLDDFRKELDFSRATEEQVSFMERLSSELMRGRTLPYPHERGNFRLRERLARFLAVFCNVRIDPETFFIGPERAQLMALVLPMVAAAGQPVLLSRSLEPVYAEMISRYGFDLVVGNDDLSELIELDKIVKPAASILAPSEPGHRSPIFLDALAAMATGRQSSWYLIDDSASFDISSSLNSNTLIRLAGARSLPPNLVLTYGLIKNTVCPDLELSFLLNAPESWIPGLDAGAELTYSRIASPTQLYYEWLFDDLLSFPVSESAGTGSIMRNQAEARFAPSFEDIASDPVFAPKPVALGDPELIRLDYGEFDAPVPDALVKGLVRGFLETPAPGLSDMLAMRTTAYLKATRAARVGPERIAMGQGVFPLLGAIVRALGERLGRAPLVAIPDGSYGPCYPLVAFHGGQVMRLPTQAEEGFVVTAETVMQAIPHPDLVWLTQPNNPSGIYFQPDAVRDLMRACAEREIYLLADEIFFLLSDFRLGQWTPPTLSFGRFLDAVEGRWLFVADGLSKTFAAGGLRCGFAACPDPDFARRIQSMCLLPPASSLRAWDALYSPFMDEAPHQMMDLSRERNGLIEYLNDARQTLSTHRKDILSLLSAHGVDDGQDTNLRGGLFVVARLAHRLRELAETEHLLVNAAEWGRTPAWSRICFSLTEERFQEALRRLERFLSVRH